METPPLLISNQTLICSPGMSPFWHAVCCVILGGAARANEFKFHDLHHAFPNKVAVLSGRGERPGAAAS